MIKKYNISKPEKYMKDGQEKTVWHNIGTMTEFSKQDGSTSRIIEIPAIGLKANLFAVVPKVISDVKPLAKNVEIETVSASDIDSEEIPFN